MSDAVGVSCDSCEWTLTVADAVERLEEAPHDRVTPSRIRRKFSSLGEGHAYFNRGHTIDVHLSKDDVARVLSESGESDD